MAETQSRSIITSCMSMTIAETLQVVARLRSPVVRTCHIGNTTANNYGWLALVDNTYLGQMEHTLYGVDDIYYPWAVLGDGGVVEACYDHRGTPDPGLVGQHANSLRRRVERKHSSFFSYGIFGEYAGEDLISRHYRLTADLARQLNGSASLSRSAEVLAIWPLLKDLIRRFHRKRKLDLLFNKWVRMTRHGYVLMLKIQRIEYLALDDVAIYTTDSALNFKGSIEALIDVMFDGMVKVSERLVHGQRPDSLSYPWINVFLNLVLNAIKEHAGDPTQDVFWHASAATNHLYVHQDWFQRGFAELIEELEDSGFLAGNADLRIIPTYSCQLFATRAESLPVLEDLISCWRKWLSCNRERANRYLAAFEGTDDPGKVVEELFREIDPIYLARMGRLLAEFNALDPNRLPIAYLAGSEHPTYNKYGMSQQSLHGSTPRFPANFTEMTWGEAELLVKMLALLVSDEGEGVHS
jgi:hypothetical protein